MMVSIFSNKVFLKLRYAHCCLDIMLLRIYRLEYKHGHWETKRFDLLYCDTCFTAVEPEQKYLWGMPVILWCFF